MRRGVCHPGVRSHQAGQGRPVPRPGPGPLASSGEGEIGASGRLLVWVAAQLPSRPLSTGAENILGLSVP